MGARFASLLALWVIVVVAFGCGGSSAQRRPADQRGGPPASSKAGGFDPGLRSRLQAALDRIRKDYQMPGASAAVVIPGDGIWSGSSGEADIRTHRAVTDRTLFAAGSITKTIVAALVLKLAESDVLDLDDHLDRWVPEFPNSGQITVRQLLNHTSGAPDFVDEPAFAAAQQRDSSAVWTPRRVLRYARHDAHEPGVDWSYSSTNYILAGLVIKRATRSTVARELHRRLLDRSRFPRILLQGDERPRGPVAVGYQNSDNDPDLEPTPNNGYVPSTAEATAAWTAGGMLSSAKDLARAGDGVFRGRLLTEASRHEMTRFVPTLGDPPEYGLGLARLELGGEKVWTHSGNISGFHADLAYLPHQHVTIAALINFQQQASGQDILIDTLIREVTKHQRSP
jgi:D-alanyl-D-alanine carboxypeptidase